MPPTEYLLRIENIIKKRNTLSDYLTRYNKGEKNVDIIAAIAMKYEDRRENEKASEFYSILVTDYANPQSEYYIKARFYLATQEFKDGNEDELRNYVSNNSDSPFCIDAYKKMVYHYADTEQKKKELSAYNEMLSLFPNDPSVLNSYAWRMAEIETNLEDALIKVRKAVVITSNDPGRQAGIIDTEAEELWKMKRFDEAIEAIERAISIDFNNQYFRDQKEKFIESKQKKQSV